jgi:hypothetical protein
MVALVSFSCRSRAGDVIAHCVGLTHRSKKYRKETMGWSCLPVAAVPEQVGQISAPIGVIFPSLLFFQMIEARTGKSIF